MIANTLSYFSPKNIALFLLYLTPFTAFVHFPWVVHSFSGGKYFFLNILICLAVLFWVLYSIKKGAHIRIHPVLILASAYVLWVIAITPFSQDPSFSFFGSHERTYGVLQIMVLLAFLFLLTQFFTTRKLWFLLLSIVSLVGTVTSLIAALQYSNVIENVRAYKNITAYFGGSSHLASFLVLTIPMTALFFYHLLKKYESTPFLYKKFIFTIIFIASIALQLFALSSTYTISAWIGLTAGTIAFGIVYLLFRRCNKENCTRPARGLTIFVVVITSLLTFTAVYTFSNEQMVTTLIEKSQDVHRSAKPRIAVSSIAAQAINEHPIFGWGTENFELAFEKYYTPAFENQETSFLDISYF